MPSSVVMPESGMYKSVAMETTETSHKHHSMSAWERTRKYVLKFFGHPVTQIFMGVLLMLTLFFADSFVLGNAPDSSNAALYSVLIAIFIVFNIEMLLLLTFQRDYPLSFYFFMDLIGNFSIILDIGWIANKFIPSHTITTQGAVIRATRAAKLAARYGRLMRIMRFFKLVRFLPCFGSLDSQEAFEPTMSAIKKVSDELSNMLSLRTAALVLILVIILPFLNYTVTDYSPNAWVTNFKMLAKNESTTWYDINNAVKKMEHFYQPKDSSVQRVLIESPYWAESFYAKYKTRDVLRHDNLIQFYSSYTLSNSEMIATGNPYAVAIANASDPSGTQEFQVELSIDGTVAARMTSMFNILTIVLVLIVLFGFTASFNEVVADLVVRPLEKMMTTLRNSAMVMLKSMKAYEEANETEEKKKGDDSEDDDDEEMETAMLEKMVEKLARIVKHVLPGAQEIGVDENIDKNTANWLNQSYTSGPAVHNPKEAKADLATVDEADRTRLKQLEDAVSPHVREQLSTWDFDVLQYSREELSAVMHYIFARMGLLEEFKVPDAIFSAFLGEISTRYLNNTYHNYAHGCDVCFTAYRLLAVPNLTAVFTTLEIFSVLVGALAHDVGHPGLNNLFLVKSKHELAMRHNDRSPLENMHCVILYEMLAKDNWNIFCGLDNAQWRESRKIILTIVLGTDMSHHFEQISKTQLFFEVNGDDTKAFCMGQKDEVDCFKDEKNRLFIMELVLHCSDISNPFKPYDLCAKWADLVVEEFCLQGDKEKSMGLEVSPMCDRDTINLCNMQMGFIEFVVAPLIIAFVNVLPPLHEIGSNMLNNFQSWGEKRKLEIMSDDKVGDKSEECRKLDERLGKFRDKMSFVNTLRELPVRRRNSLTSST